jgi:hypothetical protein
LFPCRRDLRTETRPRDDNVHFLDWPHSHDSLVCECNGLMEIREGRCSHQSHNLIVSKCVHKSPPSDDVTPTMLVWSFVWLPSARMYSRHHNSHRVMKRTTPLTIQSTSSLLHLFLLLQEWSHPLLLVTP